MSRPHSKTIRLFDRLMNLRLMAIAIYDRNKIKKGSQQQLSLDMQPLLGQLNSSIDNAVIHDLGGCVQTMALLEQMARGHEAEIQRQQERAADLRAYIGYVKESLLERMKREKTTTLLEGNHMVVLNVVDGVEHLSYR